MFNPRHSFISTSSATTYPSTLSPPKSLKASITPPASPHTSSRLHRSSRRNLRTSASSNALWTIVEDVKVRTDKAHVTTPRSQAQMEVSNNSTAVPASARTVAAGTDLPQPRPSSQNAALSRPASRPSSVHTVKAWAQKVSDDHQPPSRSASTALPTTAAVKAKPSRDRIRETSTTGQPVNKPINGLGLDTGVNTKEQPPAASVPNRSQRVAQPRKPEPLNVNPRKTESMADEWERELIQSAKNLRFDPPPDKGKSREVERDIEWEKSGRWQAEVDPTREVEDRQRRDAGREIGEYWSQPASA